MPYYKKTPYVRCGCGFRKDNTEYDPPRIAAGDYCPRCGTLLTEYNELHRQSLVLAGDRDTDRDEWSPPSRRELAVKAVSLGLPVVMVYGVFRLLIRTTQGTTITINGETTPLFDPGVANVAFAIVVFVAFVLFAIQYTPGFVKHRRLA